MSFASKLTVALAATSLIAVAASTAHATVIIPKPVINIPKPVINIAKPALHLPTVNVKPIVNVARPMPVTPKPVVVNGHPVTPVPAVHQRHRHHHSPPPPPAKPPVVLAKFEMFAAFTDQYRVVKGYYDKSGQIHSNLKSPSGRSICTATMGFSVPGSGTVSRSPGAGAIAVPAVMCNTAA